MNQNYNRPLLILDVSNTDGKFGLAFKAAFKAAYPVFDDVLRMIQNGADGAILINSEKTEGCTVTHYTVLHIVAADYNPQAHSHVTFSEGEDTITIEYVTGGGPI